MDTMYKLITRNKLNHSDLADKIGMVKGTFNNKLNSNHPAQFSQTELKELHKVLREMALDILKFIEPI